MADSTRTVKVRFDGDSKGFQQASRKGERAVGDWSAKLNDFATTTGFALSAVAGGIALGGKAFLDLGRRITDLDAKSSAVFVEQLPRIQAWAKANRKAFGTSTREVVGMAANLADLLKPMGFTAKAATDMSIKMLDLSGALSKWSGGTKSAAEVSEILTKAMLGERDELKSLGISITEAEVSARLLTKGQGKLTGAALAQAKAIATQELIMEKSTDAQTAWAAGGKAAAETQGALSSSVQETKEKIAKALIPVFLKAAKAIESLTVWVEKNQGTVKRLAILVGILTAIIIANGIAIRAAVAAQAIARGATKAWTAAQWALNAAQSANPIGLIILAIIALIAIIVLIATRTRWFQNIWNAAWGGIKAAAAAVGRWFTVTLGGNFRAGFDRIVDRGRGVLRWFRELPGRIANAVGGITSVLLSPFRSAFNAIARFWNRTVGQIGFEIPHWVPGGLGGKSWRMPQIPEFHRGGIVPGSRLAERLILARGGELVLTPEQMRALTGGDVFNVEVKAFSDRFSIRQVMQDLALHGVH